jgi:hypothetical protein
MELFLRNIYESSHDYSTLMHVHQVSRLFAWKENRMPRRCHDIRINTMLRHNQVAVVAGDW